MSPASSHTRPYGHLAQGRVRQRSGRVMGDHRSCCAAMTSTNRPRSRSLRWPCQSVLGARSHGGKPRGRSCPRDLPVCAFVSRIGITGSPTVGWRSGCWFKWPDARKEPIKYWLSTLPEDVAFRQLVNITKLRWRIERDYQELKQEVGLGHFEGRGWRGFHHHATLCIAAYGFLISERETIPPSTDRATRVFSQFALREGYYPRGSAGAARTPLSQHVFR